MSFEYFGYTFEGAWADPSNLEPRPGVFVVWCKSGDKWTVICVGESEDVKNRVVHHGEIDDWKGHCAPNGQLYYGVTYTLSLPQAGRQEIKQRIESLVNLQMASG